MILKFYLNINKWTVFINQFYNLNDLYFIIFKSIKKLKFLKLFTNKNWF